MDNAPFDHRVAELVEKAIKDSGESVNAIAKAAAVPYATLDRKLKGATPFNVSELNRLARATGKTASEFLPADDPKAVA
jgi:predicted transcriptional regulator